MTDEMFRSFTDAETFFSKTRRTAFLADLPVLWQLCNWWLPSSTRCFPILTYLAQREERPFSLKTHKHYKGSQHFLLLWSPDSFTEQAETVLSSSSWTQCTFLTRAKHDTFTARFISHWRLCTEELSPSFLRSVFLLLLNVWALQQSSWRESKRTRCEMNTVLTSQTPPTQPIRSLHLHTEGLIIGRWVGNVTSGDWSGGKKLGRGGDEGSQGVVLGLLCAL